MLKVIHIEFVNRTGTITQLNQLAIMQHHCDNEKQDCPRTVCHILHSFILLILLDVGIFNKEIAGAVPKILIQYITTGREKKVRERETERDREVERGRERKKKKTERE